jgi:predicted nucleotidyltransferase component of viral defense system
VPAVNRDSLYFKKAKLVLRTLSFLHDEKDFALHGGTAINFFVRDMPRLSVDIDLTFLPITDRETAASQISAMLSMLFKRLQRTKSTVTAGGDPESPRIITIEEDHVAIKVEANFLFTGSIFPSEQRELCQTAQTDLELSVEANVLSVSELYGGKLCAAFDRQHPRDLFDIKLLLENEGITDEIRKSFIVYLVSHGRSMAEILDPNFIDLEKPFRSEFIGMTARPVLLEELEEARKRMLRTLRHGMTDKEREFIFSIKKGKPDWSLIELGGVDRLPA